MTFPALDKFDRHKTSTFINGVGIFLIFWCVMAVIYTPLTTLIKHKDINLELIIQSSREWLVSIPVNLLFAYIFFKFSSYMKRNDTDFAKFFDEASGWAILFLLVCCFVVFGILHSVVISILL